MDVCAPAGEAQAQVIGDYLTAPQDHGVVIDGVELVGAERLGLIDAWLLPDDGDVGLGTDNYPPTGIPSWENRIDPEGAHLDAGSTWNVVVSVSRTSGQSGRADAIGIRYHDHGTEFLARGTISFVVAEDCAQVDFDNGGG